MTDTPEATDAAPTGLASAASPAAATRRPARTDPADLVTAAAVVLVIAAHIWMLSAGTFTRWRTYGTYNDDLASGFFAGHLHLATEPSAELLALPDPYDPIANAHYRTVHDAVLFRGKFYLYGGPVPALLLLPYKMLSADGAGAVGDQYLAFAFSAGLTMSTALILARFRRRSVPDSPAWTLGAGVIVVGLANPLPFTLTRASVYEAAIIGGQCFLVAGLYAALAGLFPRARRRRLAAAGLLWAAAVGCRASLAVPVAALTALALWHVWRPRRVTDAADALAPGAGMPEQETRSKAGATAALLAPLVAAAGLLGYYNYARFGSWSDLGIGHMLTAGRQGEWVQTGRFAAWQYVLPNLIRYLFEGVQFDAGFPFVRPDARSVLERMGWRLPAEYNAEPVLGLLTSFPLLLLALFPAAAALRRARRAIGRRKRPGVVDFGGSRPMGVGPRQTPDTASRTERDWLLSALLAAAVAGAAPDLSLAGSTTRYLIDATPALSIAAVVGGWMVLGRARSGRGRTWAWVAVGVLTVTSVLAGLLLGVSGYRSHAERPEPPVARAAA